MLPDPWNDKASNASHGDYALNIVEVGMQCFGMLEYLPFSPKWAAIVLGVL